MLTDCRALLIAAGVLTEAAAEKDVKSYVACELAQ